MKPEIRALRRLVSQHTFLTTRPQNMPVQPLPFRKLSIQGPRGRREHCPSIPSCVLTAENCRCCLTGEELQRQMLREKAKATSLDVQVKALCLELARARNAAGVCLISRTLSQSDVVEQGRKAACLVPRAGSMWRRCRQVLDIKHHHSLP